ncbi:DNA excision repair protein ERCC-4, partial [Tremellales sp. Uapishka_1]
MSSSNSRRHIPYLSFHKTIIREICRPQKDDLLILGKGLGLRRIICALLKTYDSKEDLVLVVNATPSDEAGLGDELGIMGVRDPGFRILTYDMSVAQREELYRHGGLFSVTSKILINDFLKGTVPAKLITGLVILHAERVSHGSQEEFAVRLYRRQNQNGFLKAFSDEPEIFAHGMSPLRDMLINLNMINAMVWPRYNEGVKVALATKKAEVVEMYQPMTDLMRQCQDGITECMEAMLVELKRDHSLNLDLEDINVRSAQFKSFDTIVRMRLKPVWHKVGAKTKIHVAALTELRNLHTWLLEYDSATFASYINTLQRQHFKAEKLPSGPGRHLHDWFNAKAAAILVEASQARVSRKALTIDEPPIEEEMPMDDGQELAETAAEFADDEAAEDEHIMETFATQTQTVQPVQQEDEDGADGEETLREVASDAPPVFRPIMFSLDEDLTTRVARRLRKGHEVVLEEQPKWSLLARVLKEIEDTIARVSTSHADAPGTNTVLIMTTSDRTCLQIRQYLTTMERTNPPFSATAGRKMMETLFLSNWQHEKNGERLSNPSKMESFNGGDEVKVQKSGLEEKAAAERLKKSRASYYKRRRQRGGLAGQMGRDKELEAASLSHKEAMLLAHSAFGGEDLNEENDGQMQWALGGSALTENGFGAAREQVAHVPAPPQRLGPTPGALSDPETSLLARAGVVEEEDLDPEFVRFLTERGLMPEDWVSHYGLLAPEDTVIIRPYGGEDDDIMLQELRPRFVVMYEPNMAFIRRLEVYKNCNPGLALRVYQMTYTNSFEEDRFLSTITREAEAFKKLIEDKQSMVIPIYNNNPRAPMRDNISRSKTTYSSRNAGGGESAAEDARIIVDIREIGALLPSLIDAAGIKVVPATLTVGDYILSPKMCVERKSLPDLEASFANGRLHTQCESMTAHYEVCILLIEFEEDKFGLRTREDSRRESSAPNGPIDPWRDDFYLQSKLVLLSLHFPRLRIIWSSSPQESVRILTDLKLNFDEPDEINAILKGGSEGDIDASRPSHQNAAAVEMLRSIPGISSHNLKYVMSKIESIQDLVAMSEEALKSMLGEESGKKAWKFVHHDSRFSRELSRG